MFSPNLGFGFQPSFSFNKFQMNLSNPNFKAEHLRKSVELGRGLYYGDTYVLIWTYQLATVYEGLGNFDEGIKVILSVTVLGKNKFTF